MKNILGCIFVLFLFSSSLFGQNEEIIEIINGEKYHIHVAEQGNTVYGIHRMYNIPIDELVKANPEIENGIQVGQRIKIPYQFVSNEEKPELLNLKGKKTHIVQPRETLFGISRNYDCSIEDIVKANPEAENGIRIGQELIIPCGELESVQKHSAEATDIDEAEEVEDKPKKNYEVNIEDSIVLYTVQSGETLYSISRRFMVSPERIAETNELENYAIKPGDVLTIPLKFEVAERYAVKDISDLDNTTGLIDTSYVHIEQKEVYKIAFLLPLKIKDNSLILSGIIDENSKLNYATEISLDFYLGIKKALDSLEKLGLNAEVKILDTQGDEATLKALINNGELKGMDMVFGPFYPKPLEVMAQWAKTNRTPLFVPVGAPREIVRNNPYVHILVPSQLTQVGAMAKYIAQNHANHNVKLIKGRTDEENELVDYFLKSYNFYKTEGARTVIEIGLGSSSGRDLARTFEIDTHNVFVCLSENYQHVMQFVNTLNAAKNQSTAHGKAKVTAFGMREWHNINSLNSYYKNRFELHTPMPLHIDYSNEEVVKVVKWMHDVKKIDPSRFFFQGFDVTFITISNFILNRGHTSGYANNFELQHIGNSHGKENMSVFIVSQKDFDLHLRAIVSHHPTKFQTNINDEETD